MNLQLFHGSPSRFERPDHEAAFDVVISPSGGRNPKGAMGLWCAPFVCDGFGGETASFRVADDARCVTLDIGRLKDLYYGLEGSELTHEGLARAFANLRHALSSRADVLFIDEASGRVGEVIVLNLDVIEGWAWHETSELLKTPSAAPKALLAGIPIDEALSAEISKWTFASDGSVERPKSLHP